MPVVSYHVGFLSGLLAPFATLRSLLEAGGSTSKTLKPLRRRRPGTRHLHGLESADVEVPSADTRHCPHCGASVGTTFDFCGECASPLP